MKSPHIWSSQLNAKRVRRPDIPYLTEEKSNSIDFITSCEQFFLKLRNDKNKIFKNNTLSGYDIYKAFLLWKSPAGSLSEFELKIGMSPYEIMNNLLFGKLEKTFEFGSYIEAIHIVQSTLLDEIEGLSVPKLSNPMTVYRGFKSEQDNLGLGMLSVGDIIELPGFVATSYTQPPFFTHTKKCCIMEINISRNFPCLVLQTPQDDPALGEYLEQLNMLFFEEPFDMLGSGQNEVLLPYGTRLKFKGTVQKLVSAWEIDPFVMDVLVFDVNDVSKSISCKVCNLPASFRSTVENNIVFYCDRQCQTNAYK